MKAVILAWGLGTRISEEIRNQIRANDKNRWDTQGEVTSATMDCCL
jgi:hypothetical protein